MLCLESNSQMEVAISVDYQERIVSILLVREIRNPVNRLCSQHLCVVFGISMMTYKVFNKQPKISFP